MKNLKLLAIAIVLFFASIPMQSQVSINVNLGTQPSWGPVGYSSVDYYYIPDIQSYYDVRTTQFIYLNGGNWIRSRQLPPQYRNYDLNRGYKVVLNDYHGTKPYSQFKYHKQKYHKGYGKPQQSIGYRDNKPGNNANNHKQGNQGHGNKGKHK